MDYKLTSEISEKLKQSDPAFPQTTLVELHVPDFEKTRKFYEELGFTLVWERYPEGFKGYMVFRLENNLICFWGGNREIYNHPYFKKYPPETVRGFGVEIVMQTSDLEGLLKKAKALDCIYEDLQQWGWGLRDFRIVDPWGFYLRFTEPHNILSDGNAEK